MKKTNTSVKYDFTVSLTLFFQVDPSLVSADAGPIVQAYQVDLRWASARPPRLLAILQALQLAVLVVHMFWIVFVFVLEGNYDGKRAQFKIDARFRQ